MKPSILIQFYRVLFSLLLLISLPSCNNGSQSGNSRDFKDAVLINNYGITSISISAKNPIIQNGKTQQYTATGKTPNGDVTLTNNVHWTVSNDTAASIDSTGHLKGLAQGNVTVTARLSTYTDSVDLRVTDGSVAGITITDGNGGSNFTVDACKTLQLKAEATFSGETLAADVTDQAKWATSATEKVAHFSKAAGVNGQLITSAISSDIQVTASVDSVTSEPPQTVITQDGFTNNTSPITVVATSNTLTINSSVQFTANAIFDDGSQADITNAAIWSSDTPSIASVSDALDTKGLVSGLSAGPAIIYAQCGPTSINGSSSVQVSNVVLSSLTIIYDTTIPRSVSAENNYITLNVGDTLQLDAQANFSDGSKTTVTPNSNTTWAIYPDNTVVSLDNTELLTALAVGTAVVKAKYQGFQYNLTVVVQ